MLSTERKRLPIPIFQVNKADLVWVSAVLSRLATSDSHVAFLITKGALRIRVRIVRIIRKWYCLLHVSEIRGWGRNWNPCAVESKAPLHTQWSSRTLNCQHAGPHQNPCERGEKTKQTVSKFMLGKQRKMSALKALLLSVVGQKRVVKTNVDSRSMLLAGHLVD